MPNSLMPGLRAVAALAVLLLAASASGAGFFDDVPAKGYIVDDVSLDALTATGGLEPVARLRYVRLSLDPGRRDITYDFWPQREMLMVQLASGEKLIFERVTRLPAATRPGGLGAARPRRPRGERARDVRPRAGSRRRVRVARHAHPRGKRRPAARVRRSRGAHGAAGRRAGRRGRGLGAPAGPRGGDGADPLRGADAGSSGRAARHARSPVSRPELRGLRAGAPLPPVRRSSSQSVRRRVALRHGRSRDAARRAGLLT